MIFRIFSYATVKKKEREKTVWSDQSDRKPVPPPIHWPVLILKTLLTSGYT